MRYISDKNISFSLPVSGQDKRFRFTPCMKGGSIYVTQIPAEMKALESSDMYGRVYNRAPGEEGEQIPSERKARTVKEKGNATEIREVTSWQEAREYLNASHGVPYTRLTTPESIASEAAAKNIAFPNLQ